MDTFFNLICAVVKRSQAFASSPLERIVDEESGLAFITIEAEGCCFPEIAEEGAFDQATDAEATLLLRGFIGEAYRCTFELNRHFARLLARKGALVATELEARLTTIDWSSYASPSVLLAGLAALPEGIAWILRLLDEVPIDHRDGLFTACWYTVDDEVREKLLAKFDAWRQAPGWGGGDGEDYWLGQFLRKWRSMGAFPEERLAPLIQWYEKTVGPLSSPNDEPTQGTPST